MKVLYLLLLTSFIAGCKGASSTENVTQQGDVYSNIFQDNYFRQLGYLSEYEPELLALLRDNTNDEGSYLIFWLKDGDCDSCIEQQMQFLKMALEKADRSVIVFADYNSKRVFSSIQSSFDFVDMKRVKIPIELSESLGSPFYMDFDTRQSSVSIYKPIPERASWTMRYLESIGAL